MSGTYNCILPVAFATSSTLKDEPETDLEPAYYYLFGNR